MILKIPEALKFKSVLILLSTLLLMSVFFSILGPNGVDWNYYSSVNPSYESIYFQREFISWLIIDIVNSIDKTGILIAALISSSLVVATYRLCFELSGEVLVSCLITFLLLFSNFYLLMSVNGLRQGISLGFLLISIRKFHHSSKFPIIFFVLSVLSHNSAVIFLPLFLVRKISWYYFIFGTFVFGASGSFIADIASKNNNPSVTENKQVFLALSIVILCFTIFHKIINKIHNSFSDNRWEYILLMLYIFVSSTAFYYSSAIYERLIYTTLPLLIIYSSAVLSVYRPRIILGLFLLIVVVFSITYTLSHPSVQNNFYNL